MKIQDVNIEEDTYGEGGAYIILLNDKVAYDVSSGEPEDNSLGRNLGFVYRILDDLKEAFKAGESGERLEVFPGLTFKSHEEYEDYKEKLSETN